MSEQNKAILEKGNTAIAEGNNEGFLLFCADDTVWTFVGDKTLEGKAAVRQWMATEYVEPPKFTVTDQMAEGDLLTVLGEIVVKDKHGKATTSSYCDVWRFRNDKIVELKAFVIQTKADEEV